MYTLVTGNAEGYLFGKVSIDHVLLNCKLLSSFLHCRPSKGRRGQEGRGRVRKQGEGSEKKGRGQERRVGVRREGEGSGEKGRGEDTHLKSAFSCTTTSSCFERLLVFD